MSIDESSYLEFKGIRDLSIMVKNIDMEKLLGDKLDPEKADQIREILKKSFLEEFSNGDSAVLEKIFSEINRRQRKSEFDSLNTSEKRKNHYNVWQHYLSGLGPEKKNTPAVPSLVKEVPIKEISVDAEKATTDTEAVISGEEKPDKPVSKVSRAVKGMEQMLQETEEKIKENKYSDIALLEHDKLLSTFLKFFLRRPNFATPAEFKKNTGKWYNQPEVAGLKSEVEEKLDCVLPYGEVVEKYYRTHNLNLSEERKEELRRQEENIKEALAKLKTVLGKEVKGGLDPVVVREALVEALNSIENNLKNNTKLLKTIDSLKEMIIFALTPAAGESMPAKMFPTAENLGKMLGLKAEKPEHLRANVSRKYTESLRIIGKTVGADLSEIFPRNLEAMRGITTIGKHATHYEAEKPKILAARAERAQEKARYIINVLSKLDDLRRTMIMQKKLKADFGEKDNDKLSLINYLMQINPEEPLVMSGKKRKSSEKIYVSGKKEIEEKIGMPIMVKEIMDFNYHLRKGDIKIPNGLINTYKTISEKIN